MIVKLQPQIQLRFMIFRLIGHCLCGFTMLSLFPAQAGQLDLNGPVGSGSFGSTVTILPNGNFIITDPGYDAPGPIADAGAVYFYDVSTLNVVSVLTGSNANDRVGNGGITSLPDGNYVVGSRNWNVNRGAATWGNGTTGLSGTVSSSNSLVGGTANDQVGGTITVLSNGNYVVKSPFWNGNRAAMTWGSGTTGVSGVVSSSNSLVGSAVNDYVGDGGVTMLPGGNFVVLSPAWNGKRGAVTWVNGTTGVVGAVSASNSLVGSTAGDEVGRINITSLANGDYVVRSLSWNGYRGAATWGSGTTGVVGAVSSSNSLVGSTPNDRVGNAGITILPNGNYVVGSGNWNGDRGAATWANGMTGVMGEVSPSNSLVGSTVNDQVRIGGITVLSNGNYVVKSGNWNGNRGAATWGNGTTGVVGEVSASNSLVGSNANDYVGGRPFDLGVGGIYVLPNGNYVVGSGEWNGKRGAATWASGTAGIAGEVSLSNSLVGSTPDDRVGSSIHVLSNGNYVVGSGYWNNGALMNAGAATWGSGTTGVAGAVSSSNSLVGSTAYDSVGLGISVLLNGNYVVRSYNWNGNRGAATWGNGTSGVSGIVSSSNSLVGSSAEDSVGGSVYELKNGNYVIRSGNWNGSRGAVTWGSGTSGVTGVVSSSNSLVGSNPGDVLGSSGFYVLAKGNYVVGSSNWSGVRGAVTWGSGTTGVMGKVSSSNSLVGSNPNDTVGNDIYLLANGNFVVSSIDWNGDRGAVTWGSGTLGVAGAVSSANSLVGSAANDQVGSAGVGSVGIIVLPNGNYVVRSINWDNGANTDAGAATWGSGTTGVSGPVSEFNSLVGSTTDDRVGSDGITGLSDGNYIVRSNAWNNGASVVAGAVTLGDGIAGTSGPAAVVNSVLGRDAYNGNFMIFSYDLRNSRLLVGCGALNRVSLFGYVPEISVSGNATKISDGDTVPATDDHTDFGGGVGGGDGMVRTFTISNTGMEPLQLTGSPVVSVKGAHAADFTVNMMPSAVVNSVAATTFQVTFVAGGRGLRTATLGVSNNDSNESPYEFAIQGNGPVQVVIESWRNTYFGNATGQIGNLEDFDADGVNNLFEFAFGTLPNSKISGAAPLQYTGTFAGGGTITAAGQPITQFASLPDGMAFRALFVRRKDHLAAGLTYTPQFSANLSTWQSSTAEPAVLADDGINQIVSVPYPSFITEGMAGFFKITVALE